LKGGGEGKVKKERGFWGVRRKGYVIFSFFGFLLFSLFSSLRHCASARIIFQKILHAGAQRTQRGKIHTKALREDNVR